MPSDSEIRGVRAWRLAGCGAAFAVAGLVAAAPAKAQSLSGTGPAASDGASAGDGLAGDGSGDTSAPAGGLADGGLRGFQDNTTASGAPADTNGADASGSATPPQAAARTGMPVPAVSGTRPPDQRGTLGRINMREQPIEGPANPKPPEPLDQGPGIRIGTFVLRPQITESLGAESQTYADGSRSSRTYAATEIRGTLASDWSRHALTVTGSGTWQKNISGTGETQPTADIAADLRLDLAEQTTADLLAGYSFYRESVSDPNAIAGAASQSTVSTFTGGAELTRDLGKLRGSLAARAIRTSYGDAVLSDGSTLSQSDRNTLAGDFTARLGYRLSGAMTPFAQLRYRRTTYLNGTDSAGYSRSSGTYAAELGLTADLGEKLSGELAAGYQLRSYEDSRLPDVSGLALDATAHWSPHRGTDVALTAASQIEDSTTPGVSGPIAYALDTTITQQVRDDVVARLTAGYLYRDYTQPGTLPDQEVYTLGTGLSWYLNRYISLDASMALSRTVQKGAHDQNAASVEVGVTARR